MPETDTSLTLLERLSQGDFLISDGATGTYLNSTVLNRAAAGGVNATHPRCQAAWRRRYSTLGRLV